MITLQIEDKEYKCPTEYKDITFSQFKEIQDWCYSEFNEPKLNKIIESKVDDEEEALNFYLDFINLVTEIPKKILMQVKPYGDSEVNDLSIQYLFETLSFLLCMPEMKEPKPVEKIGRYHFIDKTDLNEAILKDLNFIEYIEADSVKKQFNNLKEGRYEYLNLLLAIMYRPKERYGWFKRKERIELYDSEKVKERAKEFNSVTMDVVWNCLFFFLQSKLKSLKSIEESFQQKVEKLHQV